MSREIKFRVYNKHLKKFLGDEDVWDKDELYGAPHNLIKWSLDLNEESYEIQQFTGLKDKNGKEIYEGDIIKTLRCPCSLVVYEGCGFQPFIEQEDYLYDGWAENPEIIGNIFENPDLLK